MFSKYIEFIHHYILGIIHILLLGVLQFNWKHRNGPKFTQNMNEGEEIQKQQVYPKIPRLAELGTWELKSIFKK